MLSANLMSTHGEDFKLERTSLIGLNKSVYQRIRKKIKFYFVLPGDGWYLRLVSRKVNRLKTSL